MNLILFVKHCGLALWCLLLLAALSPHATETAAGADSISLTPRPHMDAATLRIYNRIRTADGLLLGLGELFAPPAPRQRWEPLYANSMQRWRQLNGDTLPACYEFEMGEANRPKPIREWDEAKRYADLGGIVWLQLSLNNFTVPLGGRRERMVVGGMNDRSNGLDPVLPGGSAHEKFTACIRQLAREIREFGRPCVLRPFHEMNGRWFWWGAQPDKYKTLWRFVFDLFKHEGVRNVIWCWAPSANTPRGPDHYPGDDMVDIIGTSQYFDDAALPKDVVVGLLELAKLGPDKPLWLAELGPLARVDFWRNAHADFGKIPRLRGFNLWLARGWHAWGSQPDRGSLIDETSPRELTEAFAAFLKDKRTLDLGRWAGNVPRAAVNTPFSQGQRADGLFDFAMMWSRGQAVGKGPVRFSHSPMRVEDIERIVPYGLMVGGHVCPIDHGYFFPKQLQPGQPHFDVLAPADGFIVMIGHRTQLTGSTERAREYDDYALTIEHSGTFYTQYDLLTRLAPAVLEQLDAAVRERFARKQMGPPVHTRIAVKAGQVIGKVGGRSLDFGVVNTGTRLRGFLTPSLYGHYAWRLHIADPFDFFDEPLKTKLLALNVRKVAPFGGRIDYDLDGRLIGNWFREGSGGYPGDRRDPRGYWMGHLAFAPHHLDPTKIVVSIGDFGGRTAQYWVKGNAPDPAKVSEADGVVKYELIWGQLGSNGQRQLRHDADQVQGVVLAQVLPNRRIKFEGFPGQAGTQVSGFTAAARIYER